MCSNEKICPENIFTVWNVADSLRSSLSLPSSVDSALFDLLNACEPYISDGFTYHFDLEE